MSNTNETHDQGCLDNNLDRLLELGEPAPGMPEDLKARIRSKLTEAGRDSVKKRILPRRWALWPVAAMVVAAVILIVLWYGNSSKAIAWADVQGRYICNTSPVLSAPPYGGGQNLFCRSNIAPACLPVRPHFAGVSGAALQPPLPPPRAWPPVQPPPDRPPQWAARSRSAPTQPNSVLPADAMLCVDSM